MTTVGIIGTGFVGGAMIESFKRKKLKVLSYDKFKECTDTLEELLVSELIFLCLPTPYDHKLKSYNKESILENLDYLNKNKFKGSVICKSTLEPESCKEFAEGYTNLNIIHNPEFLTARTAKEDYHNQKHIVLGRTKLCSSEHYNLVVDFHSTNYPWARITQCTSTESESAKLFANSFYSIKVQFFTEMYLLCQKTGCDYNTARQILIRNDWVNPMHTNVPGPDGEISYGGLCFPKDTNALNEFMQKHDSPSLVLKACIEERDTMRSDHDNCQ